MDLSDIQALDLSGRFQRHPYQALLIAVGVGYVLGGGLFTRLSLRVLRVAMRMGALPMIQTGVLGVAEAALGEASTPRRNPTTRPSSQHRTAT